MKIIKYLFRDHYKTSTDRFRKIVGLYHDYKDQQLSDTSIPKKGILAAGILEVSEPILVDEENVIYRQNIRFRPARNDANSLYLNSEFIEETITDIDGANLVPRRLDLEETETGFIYPVSNSNPNISDINAGGSSSPNGTSPVDYTSSFDPVAPPPVSNRDVIKEVIKSSRHFEDINTIVDELTILRSNFDDSYLNINGSYNFHIEEYENQIQSEIIPEEVLPNFYVVSLALNKDILNSISQDDYDSSMVTGDASPYDGLYQKFDKFITLDGNISLNRNSSIGFFFGLALVAYMQQYGEVYDSVSLDYVETVKKRFGNFFNNLSNKEILDKLNEFKNAYPMYINIEWTTKTLSPLLLFLQNAGISLQALQSFLGDKLAIKTIDNSNQVGRFSVLSQLPRLNLETNEGHFIEYTQNLFEYNVGEWVTDFLLDMFAGVPNQTVTINPELFIIDQNYNQIPVGDNFDNPLNPDIFQILTAISALPGFKELLKEQTRSYKNIIDGDFSKSEVLLYKIEKRDQQHILLQTFYIPNISGIDVQNFVDTQVKYNKTYKYKIFAFTAVYGTEYWYDKYIPAIVPKPVDPELPPNIPVDPGPPVIVPIPDPTPVIPKEEDPDSPGEEVPGEEVPGEGEINVPIPTIPGTTIEIPTGVPGYGYVFILPENIPPYGQLPSDPTEVTDATPVPYYQYDYEYGNGYGYEYSYVDVTKPGKFVMPTLPDSFDVTLGRDEWLSDNVNVINPSLLLDDTYRLLKKLPSINTDYQNLVMRLFEANVEFMVVGGWAVGAYGYPRYTGNNDFDIWIKPTMENANKVYAALLAFGVPNKMISPVKIFTVPGVVFQIGSVPNRIDILTSIDGVNFFDAISRRSLLLINNIIFPVIGKADLIANKKSAGRSKDLLDVAFLSGKIII